MLLSVCQVKIPPESCLISIPDEVYREACVYTTEEAVASCQVVGYPAMIKASWGGGGKGIRKVCLLPDSFEFLTGKDLTNGIIINQLFIFSFGFTRSIMMMKLGHCSSKFRVRFQDHPYS